MITITITFWLAFFICELVALILPFTTISSGRFNWMVCGLVFAAAAHLWPWPH
jgi:hypothetical protein